MGYLKVALTAESKRTAANGLGNLQAALALAPDIHCLCSQSFMASGFSFRLRLVVGDPAVEGKGGIPGPWGARATFRLSPLAHDKGYAAFMCVGANA